MEWNDTEVERSLCGFVGMPALHQSQETGALRVRRARTNESSFGKRCRGCT